MSENKYNFTVDRFEIGQAIDLSTALKNIKENGLIEISAKFTFAGKTFLKPTTLFYNDVVGKDEEQVYEILNQRIEDDIYAMQHSLTQVGFGTILEYIARNISKDLSVNLCEQQLNDFDYEENKFFYNGSSVSQITMHKSNQSISEEVNVFVLSEHSEKSLPEFIQAIENNMSEQLKTWLNENSTDK